jgi:hypothetical protein
MLYEKFIRVVEDNANLLTKNWIKEVKSNPSTISYRHLSDEVLSKRINDVYQRLGTILLQDDPNYFNMAEHFMKLGREREAEGMNQSEVIFALILSRVVLWNFVVEQVIVSSSLELHQELEFYQKITSFFDKAIYFVSIGYEKAHSEETEAIKQEDFVEKAVKAVTKWFIKEEKEGDEYSGHRH